MDMKEMKVAWNRRSKFEQWLFIIIVLAAIGATAWSFMPGRTSQSATIEEGVGAPAKVIRVHDTAEGLTAGSLVAVDLAVTDKMGKEFAASLKMPLSIIRAYELKAGKQVSVKYDPNDRTKVELVPEEKKP
jgi:hypothetical protein